MVVLSPKANVVHHQALVYQTVVRDPRGLDLMEIGSRGVRQQK